MRVPDLHPQVAARPQGIQVHNQVGRLKNLCPHIIVITGGPDRSDFLAIQEGKREPPVRWGAHGSQEREHHGETQGSPSRPQAQWA